MRKLINSFIATALVLLVGGATELLAEGVGDEFMTEHRRFFSLLDPQKTDVSAFISYQPDNEEDGGPGEFDLLHWGAELELFFPANVDQFLKAGLAYESRNYDFTSVAGAATGSGSETFHKIGVMFGAGHFFSNNLLLHGHFRPGIYSDLNGGIDEDDLQYFGDVTLVYQINPGTQIVLGVAFDEVFDDYPVYPLAGLRLLSEDGKLHLKLTFPIEARADYNISSKFQFYGGLWLEGDKFNVELGSPSREFDVQVHDRRVGGGAVYWLTDRINLGVEAGATVGSEFEFKTIDAGQFDEDLDTTYYLRSGLGFSF